MHKVFEQIQRFDYGLCVRQGHQNSPLNIVCADIGCNNCSAICIHCLQQQHSEHDTLPLKNYLKKLYIASFCGLQQQNLITWSSKVEQTKKQAIDYLIDLKQRFNQSIDEIITTVQMQYLGIVEYLKDVTSMKSNVIKLIKMYNELNVDNLSKAKIIQLSSINLNRANISKTNIVNDQQQIIRKQLIKMNYLNSKLKNLLKYAPVQEQTQMINQNQNEKVYKVCNTQSQLKILQQVFRQRCKQMRKILQKPQIQTQTTSMPKIKKLLQQKIKTIYTLKHNKFSWSQKFKGSVFVQNGNIMQRKGASGVERFAIFNQSLLTYIQKKQKAIWGLKITKLVGWIGIGICIKQKIVSNGYKFSYETLGHGSYLISSNGYTWSSSVQANNSAYHAFSFGTGDFVFVEFQVSPSWKLNFYACKQTVLLQKIKNKSNKSNGYSFSFSPKYLQNKTTISSQTTPITIELSSLPKTFSLDIEPNTGFHPCVNLCSVGDAVQIIE